MRLAIFVTIAMGVIIASPCLALAGPIGQGPACVRDLLFDDKIGDLGLGRVQGPGKLQFQNDDGGCPGAGSQCRSKAYVLPGDVVVTAHHRGDWVCVLFPNRREGWTEGWVRAQRIATLRPEPPRSPSAWNGRWVQDKEEIITLRAAGNMVRVKGDAYWVGANPGQVHTGGVSAIARPHGDLLSAPDMDADGCVVTMRLIGPYLAAFDDHQCGGLNVTFTGIYRRK